MVATTFGAASQLRVTGGREGGRRGRRDVGHLEWLALDGRSGRNVKSEVVPPRIKYFVYNRDFAPFYVEKENKREKD